MTVPLLITRPKAQSEEFAAQVEATSPGRFAPIISPLLEIRPEPGSVDTSGAQALLFSSRNGVREFAKRSTERGLPALCVGNATAREAASLGFSAMSAGGDASGLAALAAQSYLPDFGFMLHFRGAEAASDVTGALLGEGIPAEERIIYDQFPLYLTDEAITAVHQKKALATAFSPRSANLLASGIASVDARQLSIVAISENAAAPLRSADINEIYVAQLPNTRAILKLLQIFPG